MPCQSGLQSSSVSPSRGALESKETPSDGGVDEPFVEAPVNERLFGFSADAGSELIPSLARLADALRTESPNITQLLGHIDAAIAPPRK